MSMPKENFLISRGKKRKNLTVNNFNIFFYIVV
jgi:hypothetical protein